MGARFVDEETIRRWISEGSPSPSSSYLMYVALISQSGTSAPTVIELENTIGTITWSYEDVGQYRATATGLFTADKTFIRIQNNTDPVNEAIFNDAGNNSYPDFITIVTEQASTPFNLINGVLNETPIEIRVYP